MSGQDDGASTAPNRHLFEVDFTIRKAANRLRRGLPLSAYGGLNARRKLTWTKGLRHVVVSAQFQQKHFVGNFGNCAEHHDGNIARQALECLAELASGN